ncbi:hypothetical protein BJV74DRAFT_577760 [Russula compacta]|nr:hypothetical protein BJV74DRAFT_577760 [Russula compacta]
MSSMSLPESVGKVNHYLIPHKRDQVEAFDEYIQQRKTITPERFLEYLRGSDGDDPLPSEIPSSPKGLSIDGFLDLANDIAQSINARLDYPNDNLLVFEDTEYNAPNQHVTGTICRPDITAAFAKDWIKTKTSSRTRKENENENSQFHRMGTCSTRGGKASKINPLIFR